MNNTTRLGSISPELANLAQIKDNYRLRKTVLSLCSFVISNLELREEIVSIAMDNLRSEKTESIVIQKELNNLSTNYDDKYFQLNENEDNISSEALGFFHKARALSALAFALSPLPNQSQEAIYEAIIASDNQNEAIQLAIKSLSN